MKKLLVATVMISLMFISIEDEPKTQASISIIEETEATTQDTTMITTTMEGVKPPIIYEKIDYVHDYSNVMYYEEIDMQAFKNACKEYKEIYDITDSALEYAKKYNINPFFIVSVASLESGYGTSNIAIDKNNYFGLCCYDDSPYESAGNYETVDDSVVYFCEVVANYGYDKIHNIGEIYCTSDTWAIQVSDIMNKYIKNYNKEIML